MDANGGSPAAVINMLFQSLDSTQPCVDPPTAVSRI